MASCECHRCGLQNLSQQKCRHSSTLPLDATPLKLVLCKAAAGGDKQILLKELKPNSGLFLGIPGTNASHNTSCCCPFNLSKSFAHRQIFTLIYGGLLSITHVLLEMYRTPRSSNANRAPVGKPGARELKEHIPLSRQVHLVFLQSEQIMYDLFMLLFKLPYKIALGIKKEKEKKKYPSLFKYVC